VFKAYNFYTPTSLLGFLVYTSLRQTHESGSGANLKEIAASLRSSQ